jgi:hypothetical protein
MMTSGEALDHLRAWNRSIVARRSAAGDLRIHAMSFWEQETRNGYGSDWHPSVATHLLMAVQLVEKIRRVTGWN